MAIDLLRILRTAELAELLGVSRTTLWRWQREGNFPPPIQLGHGTERPLHGWLEQDVLDWLSSRPHVGEDSVESDEEDSAEADQEDAVADPTPDTSSDRTGGQDRRPAPTSDEDGEPA